MTVYVDQEKNDETNGKILTENDIVIFCYHTVVMLLPILRVNSVSYGIMKLFSASFV